MIGDSCTDLYIYGNVDRLSPEAPVPIFKSQYKSRKGGMALNVKQNLENLGCEVDLWTSPKISVKTRYIDSKTNYQLMRVDRDNGEPFEDLNFPHKLDADAIVVSDYDKGYLQYVDIEYLITIARMNKIPIYIDTKKPELYRLQGAYIKINEDEYNKATSYADNMIITYGGQKVVFNGKEFHPPKIDVHDVCGAGDTFLAAMVKKHLDTKDWMKAIPFAMKAASITVQNHGVYAPTIEEIEND